MAEAPEVCNRELLPEVIGEPRGGPRLGRVGITPQPVRAFFLQILEEPSRTRAKGTTVLDSEGLHVGDICMGECTCTWGRVGETVGMRFNSRFARAGRVLTSVGNRGVLPGHRTPRS